jgi:hypothetical protein
MLNKDNFQTSFTSVYLRKKILHGLLIYKKKNIINLLFDNVKVLKFVKSLKYKMSFSQQEKINIIFTGAIEPQQGFFRPVKKIINFPK